MKEKFKILMVDNDILHSESLSTLLRVVGYDVLNVHTGRDALAKLCEYNFDAIIIEIELPDMKGIKLLQIVKKRFRDIGTLILSALDVFEHAVDSLNIGADAFILKQADPNDLILSLEKVIHFKWLQRDLRMSEARYRELFENIGDGAFQMDLDGNYIDLNQAGAEILGFENPSQLLKNRVKVWETFTSREDYETLKMKVLLEGEVRRIIRRFRMRNGSLGWLETTIRTRKNPQSNQVCLEGIFRDISDRIQYQEMLEALFNLWADLSEVETIEEAGELVLEFLRATLGFDRGVFSITEGEYIIPLGDGDENAGCEEYHIKGHNIISTALRTGEPQLVNNITENLDFRLTSYSDGVQIKSELAVPVKMVDGIVGVIYLVRVNPILFTSEDKILVEIITERLALTMDRIVRSKIGTGTNTSLQDFL